MSYGETGLDTGSYAPIPPQLGCGGCLRRVTKAFHPACPSTPLTVMLILSIVLTGCNSTFSPPARTLPAPDIVIREPVSCPIKREDLALIAGRWKTCAKENAARLVESKANYAAVVADYGAKP